MSTSPATKPTKKPQAPTYPKPSSRAPWPSPSQTSVVICVMKSVNGALRPMTTSDAAYRQTPTADVPPPATDPAKKSAVDTACPRSDSQSWGRWPRDSA